MRKILLFLSLFSISLLQSKDFDFLLQTSIGIGGDKIVDISDGGNLNAGDGLSYEIGTIFKTLGESDAFDTAFTVGYLYNGHFFYGEYVSQIPVTLTEYYTLGDRWRFGVGLTYHTEHKIYGSSRVSDFKFDDAVGGVFSVGYYYGKEEKTQIGFKATIIDYEMHDAKINGNRLALIWEKTY